MRAVFDNNILVRANPKNPGPARRLLRLFQTGPDVLILSREMLQELERVLLYPRLQKRFQMPAAEIAAFLAELAESSMMVSTCWRPWTHEEGVRSRTARIVPDSPA
jgi:predicted nucleic acid-binding protein